MIARYDLEYDLCAFDFYHWLVMVAAAGATEIVFGTRRFRESIYSPEVLRDRFEGIIAPGPAFAGLSCREGDDGERVCSYKLQEFVKFIRGEGKFERLKSVRPPAKDIRYTITLRNQARKSSYRNSNEQTWRAFAGEIGARVIPDYDDEPISLLDRMALYAGAEMNFGTDCGPFLLLMLTDYPAMGFAYGKAEGHYQKCGIRRGEQLPWCGLNQKIFWEDDELDFIHQRFAEWKAN